MSNDSTIDRREFLRSSSAAGLGIAMGGRVSAPAILSVRSPNEQVVVAVMGLNGRGMVHAHNFRRLKNT
ncbi:MAG TPA: twin-arginine translocation signal domain-containing protein, partial [Gemmatimonadaceae bacterium]|nr:twin-arginine translocation signal domain-containing protein [Gemmatimonadaceae bacterium]